MGQMKIFSCLLTSQVEFVTYRFFFFLGQISIAISGIFFIPKDENSLDDINTAERANQFEVHILFTYVMITLVINFF